jgi:hypothetical protein
MPIEKYLAICDVLTCEDGCFKKAGGGVSLVQLSDLREVLHRSCVTNADWSSISVDCFASSGVISGFQSPGSALCR